MRRRWDPAWRAWRRGDIAEAARLAADPRLLFLTSYVRGRYEEALTHDAKLDALAAQALLHLDRSAEARARVRGRIPPDLRLRIDHPLSSSLDHPTVLPFADHALAPYLAAVDVTLDGHRLAAVLDTGGTYVLMGTHRAEALGIRLVANGRHHHGTTRTTTYAGIARELTLGDATLINVPVEAMPTLRGGQDVVIIGTNVLQRFRATIDYPGGRLILSPRGHTEDPRPAAARIPFYLWGSHYMFARGGFGVRQDLNYFIDSGLAYVIRDGDDAPARQACLYATARQYRSFGIPAPAPHFDTDEPITLGPLRQRPHLVATAPGRRAPWASFGGVRIDGLLSHAFLSRYAWTLDFDRHEYTFHHPRSR
jgi:hypothetical protein